MPPFWPQGVMIEPFAYGIALRSATNQLKLGIVEHQPSSGKYHLFRTICRGYPIQLRRLDLELQFDLHGVSLIDDVL